MYRIDLNVDAIHRIDRVDRVNRVGRVDGIDETNYALSTQTLCLLYQLLVCIASTYTRRCTAAH